MGVEHEASTAQRGFKVVTVARWKQQSIPFCQRDAPAFHLQLKAPLQCPQDLEMLVRMAAMSGTIMAYCQSGGWAEGHAQIVAHLEISGDATALPESRGPRRVR
jgi:hypothetical protein